MTDTGEVDRGTVIAVLRGNKVTVTRQKDGEPDMYILAKDELVECHRLNAEVRRKMLHYFARKFDVPIHHFYNPIEAWKPTTDKQQ